MTNSGDLIEAGSSGPRPSRRSSSACQYSRLVFVYSLPDSYGCIHDALGVAAAAGAKTGYREGIVIHSQMWAPGLAAFTCCAVFKVPLKFLGFRWPGVRAIAWGYLLPVAYAATAYLLVWTTKLAPVDPGGFLQASQRSLHLEMGAGVLNAALTMTYGVLQSGVSSTGEEIGWRGFLVPVLGQRLSFTGICLVSGLIWALWHFPLIVFGGYSSSAPKWVALLCFTVMIISTGTLAAWIRLKSGSVWPAAMLHACHNAVIQWLLDPMTVETGRASWFAGEFGVALAVVSALFAIACWRNGRAMIRART